MNKKEEKLCELCREYTDLNESDIQELVLEAKKIEKNKYYAQVDVFIDVYNKLSHQALVVYHKPPKDQSSMYERNIIGEDALLENEPGVLRTMQTSLNSIGFLARTQEFMLIQQRVYPIRNNRKTIGVTIVEEPLSEEILYKFESSQDNYKNISSTLYTLGQYQDEIIDQLLQEAILVFDESGQLILHNTIAKKLYKQFGYIDNLRDLDYDRITIDGTTFEYVLYQSGKEDFKDKPIVHEVQYLDYFLEVTKIWNDSEQQLIMLILDKTEIKKKESEIILKSVAIREIHHRVKNNLQTIVSLLRIQERRTESEEAKKVLRESVTRILAISSTHELLSKQIEDEISLLVAVESLVFYFRQIFQESQQKIDIQMDIDETIMVKSEDIVTISLIINELLQNIYDHAFENRKSGIVKLSAFRSKKHNEVTIRVEDNGEGYDVAHTPTSTLGLMIISSYIKDKLHGEMRVKSDENGTCTSFRFKIE